MTYSCRLYDTNPAIPYIQKQINKWIDLARHGIMLQYWRQLFTFSTSKPLCSRVSHLCFPNSVQKLRKAFVISRLIPWPWSFVSPNSRSVRESQKYLETTESCPKWLQLLCMYINRNYKAKKIRDFLFFFSWQNMKTNNDAVNVTIDFSLPPEVSWTTLHMHVCSFHTFFAVSRFQVVCDTFVVMWVVP